MNRFRNSIAKDHFYQHASAIYENIRIQCSTHLFACSLIYDSQFNLLTGKNFATLMRLLVATNDNEAYSWPSEFTASDSEKFDCWNNFSAELPLAFLIT